MEQKAGIEIENFSDNFEVLPRINFFKDFAREASTAKTRVWLRAMYVQHKEAMVMVEPTLSDAASRGLDVRVVADSISLNATNEVPSYLAKVGKLAVQKKETREMFERLTVEEVKVSITNEPTRKSKLIPYVGRSHIKMAVVDDVCYIGGSNWTDVRAKDFMVKITNPKLVEKILPYFEMFDDKKPTQDIVDKLDGETTLLIDSGVEGKSIIYDKAIELVKNEQKRIAYVSQLIPEGEMLDELISAKNRGVDIEIIVPKMSEIKDPQIYAVNRLAQKRMIKDGKRIPIAYLPFFVHAKALIGSSHCIVGSHNFSETGVKWGTEEIALESSNKVLLGNLRNFIQDLKQK